MTTGFPSAALAGAPVGMVVDPHEQLALVVSQIAIAVLVIGIVIWRSSRTTVGVNLAVILAAGLAVTLESLADAMLLIWHPAIGQWTVLSAYGHHVPVWVSPCFMWAFGGQSVWFLAALRRKASTLQLWKLYAIFALTDFIFETPSILTHGVIYYGDQPLAFPLLPLPLYLPFGNALTTVMAAVMAFVAEKHLDAARLPWIVVPLALTAMTATLAAYSWPVSITLNSEVSTLVRWLAGLFSIGLSLTLFLVIVRVFGRDSRTATPA
jgi:hypothetical protein